MDNNKIKCSNCGKVYEEDELESCNDCEKDFCDDCLNDSGYCLNCE